MNNFKYIWSILVILLPLTSEATYYRWIDSNGITHYASSIPPSAAQQGHVEINKAGFKKKTVISAKKKRKQAILKKKLEAQKKAYEKIRKENAKQEEEEIRLLSIFSSEEEVIKAYNSKLRMAQLTIDLLKSRHKKQSERLEKLEVSKEGSKNQSHKYAFQKQIDVALDNLSIYQQAITENIVEKDRVRKEFKNTLGKFQKLTAKQDLNNTTSSKN